MLLLLPLPLPPLLVLLLVLACRLLLLLAWPCWFPFQLCCHCCRCHCCHYHCCHCRCCCCKSSSSHCFDYCPVIATAVVIAAVAAISIAIVPIAAAAGCSLLAFHLWSAIHLSLVVHCSHSICHPLSICWSLITVHACLPLSPTSVLTCSGLCLYSLPPICVCIRWIVRLYTVNAVLT